MGMSQSEYGHAHGFDQIQVMLLDAPCRKRFLIFPSSNACKSALSKDSHAPKVPVPILSPRRGLKDASRMNAAVCEARYFPGGTFSRRIDPQSGARCGP